MEALLTAREALMKLAALHAVLLRMVKNDELCTRFMGIPGGGPVTALAFKTLIDRPDRFRRSADVGAHLGLASRQFQSGETDRRGRIAKTGDELTRTALFAAANVMLSRSTQWTPLKHWGITLAKRSSLKGEGGGGAQARRDHAPDVARRHAVPLDRSGSVTTSLHPAKARRKA
jgi:transposase